MAIELFISLEAPGIKFQIPKINIKIPNSRKMLLNELSLRALVLAARVQAKRSSLRLIDHLPSGDCHVLPKKDSQ
jgi:hypothetical protein